MPKIVLARQDDRLLETRAAVLRKTGANVVYCEGSETLNVVESEMPDLLVLCHSLQQEESEAIADLVHSCCPKTKVFLIVLQIAEETPHQDSKFDGMILPEPSQLLACASELLHGLPYASAKESALDGRGPAAA